MKGRTAYPRLKAYSPKPSARPSSPSVFPMNGEQQEAFFNRAMRALRLAIPSVNQRAREVLRLWCESRNDRDLRDKALAQFPSETFVHFGPRCIFIEHTVPADERVQREAICYDRPALLKLVRWANYRIRNSDNFAAISDGHTPSDDERAQGAPMPEVLGYSGPFYLGLLGDVDPKWAIYAEEWIHRGDVPRFEKLQRRSPEVWVNEPMERRTIDPIAALGAETPRLDSGMNPYSRVSDGQTVMRYSATAFPGPSNTFVPASERRTQRYAGDPSMDEPIPGNDEQSMPYLIRAVQSAVEALMPSILQAVHEQLVGSPADPEQEADVDDADVDDEEDSSDGDAQSGDEEADNDDTVEDEDESGDAEDDSDPADDMDDDERSQYEKMSSVCQAAYLAGRRQGKNAVKYSRDAGRAFRGVGDQTAAELHRVVARQQLQLKELRGQLERERRDVVRYSRLNELAHKYAFDANEESETCHDMTDAQFDRHCSVTIAKYARRDDATNVDFFNDPTLDTDRLNGGRGSRVNVEQVERYSREAASIAARKNAAKRGSTTFEAEFEAICKQHGVTV